MMCSTSSLYTNLKARCQTLCRPCRRLCVAGFPQPDQVLHARPSASSWELLVRWADQPALAATWEALEDFKEAYLEFQLEDMLFQQGGGNVMDQFFGNQYWRRPKKGPTVG
jgi:hypothetical protein